MEFPFNNNEHGLWQYLLAVAGGILVFFAVARLMSEKRQPSNTVAWLLAIVLIPWLGVPLYLLLGGRKLRRLAGRKSIFSPVLPGSTPFAAAAIQSPAAQIIAAAGACPALAGNSIRFLTDGEEAYTALEHQIRSATTSIDITTFILARDDTGRRFIRLLADRAREGVQVRLLLDAVGCLISSHGFCDPLREAGGEVRRFMPVLPFFSTRGSANLRNHRKIAVFDQRHAIVGGHNIAREYMGPGHYRKRWKDFGAEIHGPAAALLNEVFLADWSFASGQPVERLRENLPPLPREPAGESALQVVASGPDIVGDPLYEAILSLIQEAERSIWIVTPYFIPDEVLLRSLIVKARAGREVVLIIPARSNHPVTDFARRHYLRELQSAGAHIRLYGPGMMHSKAMIVDDRYGMLGSANFDLRSLFVNFEIGVMVYSEADARAMKQWALQLLSRCQAPAVRQTRRARVFGNVAEELSRLLAPLL
ncbi:major cardiolipin synthase ClsA [mine drainage metagenome]|uniref:Major cardiolipin synthase ClsA n=1 Tax=mine drainage metagenome TaxID=410659 RepID=A0A1J5SY10_9ZZZZ